MSGTCSPPEMKADSIQLSGRCDKARRSPYGPPLEFYWRAPFPICFIPSGFDESVQEAAAFAGTYRRLMVNWLGRVVNEVGKDGCRGGCDRMVDAGRREGPGTGCRTAGRGDEVGAL